MRTTVTLNADIDRKIKQKIRMSGRSAKEVYNDLLRAALAKKPFLGSEEKFNPPVFDGKGGLMPGFSWDMPLAQVLDKLDETEFAGDK